MNNKNEFSILGFLSAIICCVGIATAFVFAAINEFSHERIAIGIMCCLVVFMSIATLVVVIFTLGKVLEKDTPDFTQEYQLDFRGVDKMHQDYEEINRALENSTSQNERHAIRRESIRNKSWKAYCLHKFGQEYEP